jgi:hypothetical protein
VSVNIPSVTNTASQIEANLTWEGEATQVDMADLIHRMADLKVRGTTCRAGYLVFSVIDFVQQAHVDAATYEAATWAYRDLVHRHHEAVGRDVVMIQLARGGGTYRTEAMRLRGLHMLLTLLGDKVEPEFRRIFEGIIAGIA